MTVHSDAVAALQHMQEQTRQVKTHLEGLANQSELEDEVQLRCGIAAGRVEEAITAIGHAEQEAARLVSMGA